jgi:type VI secretion system protein ImpL
MKKASRLRFLVGLSGIVAVTALIWLAGPLLSFGDGHPLEDPGPRIVAIAAVLVLAAGVIALRTLRRRLGAERIASGMHADESDEPVLAERMKEALAKLRNLRGGKANYLYELPWYLLIGPPGSGKTTALVNSGLEFPLAKGVVPDKLKGVGGTRYCDWWFTEDAVLIDTAGRYTTQDSDARFDQRSWLAFLDLLRRNRPRQPINGVLLAISLEDLLTLPEKEIAAHARAIRARLAELHARLEVEFPVYALFTKADLVCGFMEYFGGLDEKGRAQVFGTTFQTMDKTRPMLGEVPAEFDALVERLTRGLEERLAEEKDATSRVLLFGFPAQIAALRTQLSSFLSQIFEPTQKRSGAALRGFYFTSGTQLGTPIDQLLGALTKGFGAQAVGTPAFSGVGKSFFLTDLVKKVVIGEAGWVSTSRSRRLFRFAALAGLLVAAPLLIGAWWTSYAGTSAKIDRSAKAAADYAKIAAPIGRSDTITDPDPRKVLPALQFLRDLPGGTADPAPTAGGLEGFGLGQDARLRSAARTAYDHGLDRLLRPRLLLRLEEQLEAKADDPNFLFGALEAYLMLGGLVTADRQFLINWMERDWSADLYPGERNGESRKELVGHLVDMLDLDAGLAPSVSLNGPLIDRTRAELARVDVAERAFRLLAERAKASLHDGWVAARNGGAGTLVVFDATIEAIEVPYFFTKAGYVRGFSEKLDGIAAEIARDRRVLGPAGQDPAVAARYEQLQQDLGALYAKSFIAAWRDAIGRLSIRNLTAERPTYPLMVAAASTTSPIARILESIREETSLPETPAREADEDTTPARRIDAALRPYHLLVEGPPGRRPIDLVLARLARIRSDLTRLAGAGDDASALGARVTSEAKLLEANTESLPQPFAEMMATTADAIEREVAGASVAGFVETLQDMITFPCQERITSRYPFARDADQDVTLEDFTTMFGPDGKIAKFVSEHLARAVDRSGPTWKWRGDTPLAKLLSPSALADFQRAAEIRQAFFTAGREGAGFSVSVIPPSATNAKLEIGRTMVTSEKRSAIASTIHWPGEAETGRAALVVTGAGGAPTVIERTGQWALFRLLDSGRVSADGTVVTFNAGGRPLQYRFNSSGSVNPLNSTKLRSFHCPTGA